MTALGRTVWVIPGGHIPASGTGREPDFTSRDEIWLLNTGDEPADLTITIYSSDAEPVGPYELRVEGRRVRCVRINDLIDPQAVFLERDYAAAVRSSTPLVVQVARYDTRRAEQAMSWSLAFPADPE